MKQELFLEEAVLDDLAHGLDSLEVPLSQKAFRLIGIAVFCMSLLVIGRVLFLGWWRKDFYTEQSLVNVGELTTVRAPRGVIFDRFNKPIVKNIPSFRLTLRLVELFKNDQERETTINSLGKILNLQAGYLENLLSEVNLEKQNTLTIARDLTLDEVIEIKNLNLKSVQIEDDFKRQYSGSGAFSHLIGYIGSVNPKDSKREPSFSLNDVIGKDGLEMFYDRDLRGEDGKIINYRNAKGEIIDNKLLKEPTSGDRVYTTIDSEFQSFFYQSLRQAINRLGSRAAIGIAINPQNGEILSLVNFPSFDNNNITPEDISDPTQPFFNRAISGLYPPGSTIKPLVAYAALKENIISPTKEIFSPGYLEIPNPYNPDQPSIFLDWKPHGWVNLFSALARSSNVYFYSVGGGAGDVKGLGIEKLKEHWGKFGLGEKTGIDLPSEARGFLPDPETKEKNNGVWRIGDTYNVSIGQGDLLLTPIQLLNYISVFANGGRIYKPFIVKKILQEDGKLIKEAEPVLLRDYNKDSEIVSEVQRGMIDAVEKSYGTANLLADLPFSVAAKTGTAQVSGNKKINALFVGYAPIDNAQLLVLVLVEEAKEGSLNAVPVAKEVMEWYYYNRITNKE